MQSLGRGTTYVNGETIVTSQQKSPIYRLSEISGVLPGLAVFYTSAVWIPSAATAVLLLIGVRAWWIPAEACSAFLLALLWFFLFRRLSRQESLLLGTLVLCSICLAAWFSVFFYDMSFDGRWYHTDAILGLLRGVNPIYQQFSAPNVIFANHYPKATWYFAALVIHTFHNFQLGKIYNPLLIFASAAYAAHFFRQLGLSGGYAKLLVAATALNPIAASQLTTYYIDGAMGSLMSLAVMIIVNLILHGAALDRLLFVLVASLAISIKFTGGAYVAVGILVLFVAPHLSPFRKALDRRHVLFADIGMAAAALFLGVMVMGYDPYITNARQGLHPLYPMMGPNKIDLIGGQLPAELKGRNPAQKFLISFFSETRGFHKTTLMDIPVSQENLKIPFTVHRHELIALGLVDLRFAGWGIFFSGITVTSLVLFIRVKGWRGHAPVLLGLALATLTSFINPEVLVCQVRASDCALANISPDTRLVYRKGPRTKCGERANWVTFAQQLDVGCGRSGGIVLPQDEPTRQTLCCHRTR